MPFAGLLDQRCKELTGLGYHRLDMSALHFKISPASPFDPESQMTFVADKNLIFGPALDQWGEIAMLALFGEPDVGKPFCRVLFTTGSKFIKRGESLSLPRGLLTFPIKNLPWESLITT